MMLRLIPSVSLLGVGRVMLAFRGDGDDWEVETARQLQQCLIS